MKRITADFQGVTILVVDDYPLNQELTKEMLEMMKCEVDVADDGQEGYDKYLSHNYDLIFMDVQMPVKDGYQCTGMIREHEEKTGTHIPIVAVTANALEGDREKCIDSGMDDYISKPVKSELLEEMIKQYVGTTGS